MKPLAVALVLVLVLGLAACGGGGDGKEEKASNQVCDARADIQKQVNTLKGLTVSTATTSQITKSLNAIGDDLAKIKDARGNLSGDRKQEVDQANKDFESSVKSIASDLGTATSLSDAKSQLSAALQKIATSYEETFAKIDC